MTIVVRNSYEKPSGNGPTDIAVFVDVFRASTTLLTILDKRPSSVFLTNDEESANDQVALGAVLFSEVFNGGYDNSPSQAAGLDLFGKNIVHKSTNLTNAIFHHQGFKRGFIGGFVNLSTQVRYLSAHKNAHIELVAASHFGKKTEAVEDRACVQMMMDRVDVDPLAPLPLRFEIEEKIKSKRTKGTYSDHYFEDAELALRVDQFHFLAEIKILSPRLMQLQRID